MSEPAGNSASSQPVAAVAEYKLADVISLYSQQISAQNQLWAFYTTTVLGSIVFILTAPRAVLTAGIFLPPYWLFGLGELFLIHQVMRLLEEIRASVRREIEGTRDRGVDRFHEVFAYIAAPRNPFWITAIVQIAGHACVTLLFLGNVLRWYPIMAA